ncbi:MAG: hypothetical protein K6F55_08170 [Eubacterium sp.]|nr:hypothetical protein [Eubacterium sp.]
MKKKALSVLLVLTMAVSMAACGASESATGDSSKDSKVTAEQTTAKKEAETTSQETEAATTAASEEAKAEETTAAKEETTAASEETTEAKTEATTEAAPASASEAAESGSEDSSSDENGFYSVCTDIDKQTVESYAANAKETYLQANWVGISEMLMYPADIAGTTVNNADEFLSFMENRAISGDDRAVIEDESCVDMFANSVGVCLGSGQIWIGENPDNPGTLGIISISGVVER